MSTLESMTGFGAASFQVAGVRYRVQVRAVNHRHLNLRFHMPHMFQPCERPSGDRLKGALLRGSVDVRVESEEGSRAPVFFEVNQEAMGQVIEDLKSVASELGLEPPTMDALLRFPDLVKTRTVSAGEDEVRDALAGGLDSAVAGVCELRLEEGAKLAEDLDGRLARLQELVKGVAHHAPEVLAGYEARLRKRLDEATQRTGLAIDEARLATEIVLFCDKSDISEELVRAQTHLEAMRALVTGDNETRERGKRLDFLCQELGRELNTLGAKCRDAGIAGAVVDGKVELERVREQAQNIL